MDLSYLALHSPYQGNETIVLGDGSGHPITHTGSTSLPLRFRSILLNNVLYAPNIEKNLMSVRQTCADNGDSITFDSWSYQVKDLATGALLKTGSTRNGMYKWLDYVPSSAKIQVLSVIKKNFNDRVAFSPWSPCS